MFQLFQQQWKRYQVEFEAAWQDLKTKGRRTKQIPNILTSLRLLAPFFILPTAYVGNIPWLIGFVSLFSVTDMLDGFIARKFHLTSELGKDLDAFCDKMFAGTLLLAASFMNPILLMNLALEVGIGAINTKAKLKGMDVRSLYIGKIKTGFLFPLIGLGLISTKIPVQALFESFFAITCSLQVVTACSYARKYVKAEELEKRQMEATKMDSLEMEEEQKRTVDAMEPSSFIPAMLNTREKKIETLKEMKSIVYQEVLGEPEEVESKAKEKVNKLSQ